ncbi:MAG: nuclear transport factor 2 family protein [Candidatus Dadabacteria bacterium]|nr:MAG: nuclear transport factor 2 family protein [Candidatus Dadabacteria bacterium]
MPVKSDRDLVLEANERFYKALGARDLSLMDTVFVRDERAGCTHPGWVMLRGWEAIRQSWENIFDPEDRLSIKLHNVTVDVKENAACVTCIQELTYINRDPVTMNVSVSTNLFERTESGWLMVIHHASPIPFVTEEASPEKENNNLQ